MPNDPSEIPRGRVLSLRHPRGAESVPANKRKYDQTTMPDSRTPGSDVPLEAAQFRKVALTNLEGRRARAKKYPLKNGLPYVPTTADHNAYGVVNLFDPTKPTNAFAMRNTKMPLDSLLKHPSNYDQKMLRGKEMSVQADINYAQRDGFRDWVDSTPYNDLFFLADRPHDLQKHRNDRIRNGMVNLQPYEAMIRAVEMHTAMGKLAQNPMHPSSKLRVRKADGDVF